MQYGTQLYVFHQHWTSQGTTLPDQLGETLSQVKAAGLDGFEASLDLLGTHDAQLVSALDATGLKLASMYAGGGLHTDELAAETIGQILSLAPRAKELGAEGVTVNPQPRLEPRKTDAELARQAAGLDELGRSLGDLGLRLNIHTHSPEMVDDAREFRSLLDLTNPDWVGLCLDTHWVYRGGGDVPALTKQYLDRIGTLHVRQSHDGVWAETFCEGDLDHHVIASLLAGRGYDGWVLVELAWEQGTPHTRPLVENLRLSRQSAQQVFGE